VIVTVFRSRLRAGVEELYDTWANEMSTIAHELPGFVEEKTFVAEDGERVTIVLFVDQTSHDVWRTHPRHQVAQQIGREKLYSEYHVYSAEIAYSKSFLDNAVF